MRECWINVYVLGSGTHVIGWTCGSLAGAQRAAQNMREAGVSGPAYRLHVRLKPGRVAASLEERIARGDYGRIVDPTPEPETRVDERGRVWIVGPTSSFRAVR